MKLFGNIVKAMRRTRVPASGARRLPPEAHEFVANINEISKHLATFEGLGKTFPEILAIAAKTVPIRSALIIEARSGTLHSTVWHPPGAVVEAIDAAQAHAQAAFAYLTRLGVDATRHFNANKTLEKVALTTAGLETGVSSSLKDAIVLPLVVDHHPIFGVLLWQGITPADEASLAFINALANQLAVALDRQFLREAQSDLIRREHAAEEANKAKSAFLANMSHEIRTPLGAILGFSELLASPDVPVEQRTHFATTIKRNGALLVQLIDDILDLSKVEAGKLDLHKARISLPGLMAEVTALLSLQARQRGISFKVSYTNDIPDTIYADPARVKQILINVIGNAIKFTDHGSVTVKVQRQPPPKGWDFGKVAFVVTDTGVGISAEDATRLFQPFMQSDGTTTRRFGGTGLGLVLARRLANAMGGDIVLTESAPGKGSTFTITIDGEMTLGQPLKSAAEESKDEAQEEVAAKPVANPAKLLGKKILLVEDTPDMQLLLNRVLRAQGAEVDLASNGEEGVDRALQTNYDIILMDLQIRSATASRRRAGSAAGGIGSRSLPFRLSR